MKYLKDLQQIIEINSYTQNKIGVDKVGKVMTSWLEEIGFETTTYKRELLGDHLLFKTKKEKDFPKILLLGHNDTVFPQGYFESFTEDENFVYGPGVCDMKGGNIVALQALRNIYEKNRRIYNIDFMLVSDEETGSDDSSQVTSEIAKDYDYCFVFEAAGKDLEVVTARKGVGRYLIDIKGKASHAGTSYTKGINANLEAAHKLVQYSNLINLEKGTIINVGKVEGGIGINTVSPEASMKMEFRFDSVEEQDRVMREVKRITNHSYVEGTISNAEGIIQRGVMQENSKQLELIALFETIIGEKIPKESRGGVSDANIIASMGTTTLDGFGPYGDGDHTIKERALKSSFDQRIAMMTKILNYFFKKD